MINPKNIYLNVKSENFSENYCLLIYDLRIDKLSWIMSQSGWKSDSSVF